MMQQLKSLMDKNGVTYTSHNVQNSEHIFINMERYSTRFGVNGNEIIEFLKLHENNFIERGALSKENDVIVQKWSIEEVKQNSDAK